MSAAAADNAGILKLKMLVMVNIDMFKHPKYYKELRKRNKLDQAISEEATDVFDTSVRPGPGLKQQATSKQEGASNQQSTSSKAQATSLKP